MKPVSMMSGIKNITSFVLIPCYCSKKLSQFSDLNNTHWWSCSSLCRSELWNGSPGLKSGVSRAPFLLEALERILTLVFQFLEMPTFPSVWPFPAVSSLWPLFLSSHFLWPYSSAFCDRDFCDYIGSTGLIWFNLPISRPLTWSHLQSPFYQVRRHIHIFWD